MTMAPFDGAFFMPTHGSNEEIIRESGGTSK